MPDISQYLQKIKEAKYGEEVRGSIHDGIKAINDYANSFVDEAAEQVELARAEVVNAHNAGAEQVELAAAQVTLATEQAQVATTQAQTATSQAQTAASQAAEAATQAQTATAQATKAENEADRVDALVASIGGALKPHGTIMFADLPAVNDPDNIIGDSYNIADAFVTTADFKSGAGVNIPAGANVYLTADGKWDVLATASTVKVENGVLYITPSTITI